MSSLPLASSEEGKKFVMKALHPADHEIKATRVPGGMDNTVAFAIDQLFDIPLDHDSVRLILAPCLEAPFMTETIDLDTAENPDAYRGQYVFQPPAFGGPGLVRWENAGGLPDIRKNFESIAITSESFTAEFIAPALSNQGAICSCQYPNVPQIVRIKAGQGLNMAGDADYTLPYCCFDDYPRKSSCLSGTRAYSGKLTGGIYVPLRLSDFKQKYINDMFCMGYGSPTNQSADGSLLPRDTFSTIGYLGDRIGMSNRATRYMPFGNTWSITYADGYAKGEVSLRVRFRMTIEGRVYPGSQYAPMAEPPPAPDSMALKMYHEIAGRLVNAYPASYNDWNKLKGSVLSMANALLGSVAPWIKHAAKGLPFGSAISMLSDPLIDGATKWVRSAMKGVPTQAVPPMVPPKPTQKVRRKRRPRRKSAQAAPQVIVIPDPTGRAKP